MDKCTFFHLHNLVEGHLVFHTENAHHQAPVVRQLAVCLDQLGHNGNGACLNHLIPNWGVSNGSLVNFSKRCFVALKDQIKWPTGRDRTPVLDAFARLGFRGCIGLIDGSLMPLTQRPHLHGECYYDRKSRYSINAQVVCKHQRKITYLYTGGIYLNAMLNSTNFVSLLDTC